MKHLITFQESLKNKGINTYDIGKTNYDPEHPWRGVRKNNIKKSDYSGIMNHWRKIESPFSMKRDEKYSINLSGHNIQLKKILKDIRAMDLG